MNTRAHSQAKSSSTPSFTPAPVNLVQRKCACGGSAGLSGECDACQKNKLVGDNASLIQPKLKISQPNDPYEQEADRVADEVMRMPEPRVQRQIRPDEEDEETIQRKPIASQITPLVQGQGSDEDDEEQVQLKHRSSSGLIQRQGSVIKPKSNEDNAKEALKKIGEAFLKTEPGKAILKKGKEFVASLPGTVITGTAAVGAVTALIATNKTLPIQAPAIPLDKLHPGLSMKFTIEGPLQSPTKAMISFSGKFGLPKRFGRKKTAKTESEELHEKSARLRREQFEFRESLKTPEERERQQQRIYKTITDRLTIPGLKSQEEAPAIEKEKKEEASVQRKEANNSADVVADTSMIKEVMQFAGQPLDANTRDFMEQRFGYDFSQVRIHTDSTAAASARELNAQAYTTGHNIVFTPERYMPQTRAGRKLLAHELTHVVQQSSGRDKSTLQRKQGPGRCGLLDTIAATVLGSIAHSQIQEKLTARGFAREFMIPRATKLSNVLSKRCMPIGTPFGFADVARIARPNVAISEIKPYLTATKIASRESQHYCRRAIHSMQRITGKGLCGQHDPGPDDVTLELAAGPYSASSTFSLLKGAIKGRENFGPYLKDPQRDLIAEEVGPGAIGYWCVLNKKGKQKKKEGEENKKKKKDAKEKAKDEKKKANKKTKPKTSAGAIAGSVGFGISIFSASTGVANAGVGVSVGSTSAAAGTVGAGVDLFSDTAAAGTAGVRISKDSATASAASVGADISDESELLGAGTAGAGVAGSDNVKDSTIVSAGATDAGETTVAKGASTAGSAKKSIDPKDVSGPDADKVPAGESDPETEADEATTLRQNAGEKRGAGSKAETINSDTGSKEGIANDTKVGAGPSVATGQGAAGSSPLAVMPIFPANASDADREMIAVEAAKVTVLVHYAEEGQKKLMHYLASKDTKGQYMVPTSAWIEKMLNVTAGMSLEDIEFIKTLDWRPGNISEQELRERLKKALEKKDKPKTNQKDRDSSSTREDKNAGQAGDNSTKKGSTAREGKKHDDGFGAVGAENSPTSTSRRKIHIRDLNEGEPALDPTSLVTIEPLDFGPKHSRTFSYKQKTQIRVRYTIPGFGNPEVTLNVRVDKLNPLQFSVLTTKVLESTVKANNQIKHIPEDTKLNFTFNGGEQ